MRRGLLTIFVAALLAGCGGDDDAGGITVPGGDSSGGSDFEKQSSVRACIELWNSAENQPARAEVQRVLTFTDPPRVAVELSGRCTLYVVFEDERRAYRIVQGEGPDGAPYELPREADVGSLRKAQREGKLRFAAGDDPQLSRGD